MSAESPILKIDGEFLVLLAKRNVHPVELSIITDCRDLAKEQDVNICTAIDLLLEMIDGGEECRGRDSQISHVIGVLRNDPNHTWLAKKRRF